MSKDPQHPSSEHDEYPYGEDPYGEQAIPYQPESAQTPYEAGNPYGASQYPYGDQQTENPPDNYIDTYNTPGGYQAQQAAYGIGDQHGYNSEISEAVPLPLWEAIQQLPRQYLSVVTRPSVGKFRQEKGHASWDIVWVQLLGLAIITAITGYLATLINAAPIPPSMSEQYFMTPGVYQAINAGASIGIIVVIPLFFFMGIGILQLLAKMLKGQGSFLQYTYSILLFTVPLHILIGLFRLIPVAGPSIYLIAAIISSVYETVLCIFATIAVHRVSGARGAAVVLIPFFVALLLFACAFAALVSVFTMAAMR